jgi:uncharacterized OB-fold protein
MTDTTEDTAVATRVGWAPADFATLNPDSWTQPFWTAAQQHRLVVPRCTTCATFRFPPTPYCHECTHQDVDLVEMAGTGTVYSYTVARHAPVALLAGSVPYVIGVIDIDGAPGIRMIANIVDCNPDTVVIGDPVTVVWDDIDDEVTIPRFRPSSTTRANSTQPTAKEGLS